MNESTITVTTTTYHPVRLADFVSGGPLTEEEKNSVEDIEETLGPGGVWAVGFIDNPQCDSVTGKRYFYFGSITAVAVLGNYVTIEQGSILNSFYFVTHRLAEAYAAMLHELQLRFFQHPKASPVNVREEKINLDSFSGTTTTIDTAAVQQVDIDLKK